MRRDDVYFCLFISMSSWVSLLLLFGHAGCDLFSSTQDPAPTSHVSPNGEDPLFHRHSFWLNKRHLHCRRLPGFGHLTAVERCSSLLHEGTDHWATDSGCPEHLGVQREVSLFYKGASDGV